MESLNVDQIRSILDQQKRALRLASDSILYKNDSLEEKRELVMQLEIEVEKHKKEVERQESLVYVLKRILKRLIEQQKVLKQDQALLSLELHCHQKSLRFYKKLLRRYKLLNFKQQQGQRQFKRRLLVFICFMLFTTIVLQINIQTRMFQDEEY